MRIESLFEFPTINSAVLHVYNNDNLKICESEIKFEPNNEIAIEKHYFLRNDKLIRQAYLDLLKGLPEKITKEELQNLLTTFNTIYAFL